MIRGKCHAYRLRFLTSFPRRLVLDPYRPAFDPKHLSSDGEVEIPHHRHLFHCYTYQYHLLQLAILTVDTVSNLSLVVCTPSFSLIEIDIPVE